MTNLDGYATVFEIGADGRLGVKLPRLGPLLAQGNATAQPVRQPLHLLAQLVHVTVRERLERFVHEVIDPGVGWALAHVFGNALPGVLVDLLFHCFLVGADQLAQLLHALLAHAHLLEQFHHLLHGLLHFFELHGAHHALGHPIAIAHIIHAVQAGHLPQLAQLLLGQLFATQQLFHQLAQLLIELTHGLGHHLRLFGGHVVHAIHHLWHFAIAAKEEREQLLKGRNAAGLFNQGRPQTHAEGFPILHS